MSRIVRLTVVLVLSVVASARAEAIVIPLDEKTGGKAHFWLASSMQRIFNKTAPGDAKIDLLAARSTRFAFQACFRNEQLTTLTAGCKVIGADDLKPQIRYVGMAPMHH